MFQSDQEQRRSLAQVVGAFVEVVSIGVSDASPTDQGERPRVIAAREASRIIRSFIASDRMYLATELVPMYQVMGSYLPEYAPGVDFEAMLDVDERDDVGVFRELDVWKYAPSELLTSLLVVDKRNATQRALDYVETALRLAQVVCTLDGRVVEEELYDLKQFEEMLVNEVDKTGMAASSQFDSQSGRWLLADRQPSGTGDRRAPVNDPVLDELLSTFFSPRISRQQARLLAEAVDHPCATPGCRDLATNGQLRCPSCSQFVTAARINGVWHEIEDVADDFDVAPADGCPNCGAIYLTVKESGAYYRLRCQFCRETYPLRRVRRYLVEDPS
jgi:hypothetical protein